MHTVSNPSAKKAKSYHCGTVTKADFLRMERAARRANDIASGINPTSGCSAFGGGKRQKRRKARRQGNDETRMVSNDW